MKLPIEFEDDGKGKWQSVAATLTIGDELANIYIMDWGKDEEEAEAKVMKKFAALLARLNSTRESVNKEESQ